MTNTEKAREWLSCPYGRSAIESDVVSLAALLVQTEREAVLAERAEQVKLQLDKAKVTVWPPVEAPKPVERRRPRSDRRVTWDDVRVERWEASRKAAPTPPPWKLGQMLIHPGTHQIIKIEAVGALLTYRYWQMDTWASMVSKAYPSDFTLWHPYPRVGDWVKFNNEVRQVERVAGQRTYLTDGSYIDTADLEPASPPVEQARAYDPASRGAAIRFEPTRPTLEGPHWDTVEKCGINWDYALAILDLRDAIRKLQGKKS